MRGGDKLLERLGDDPILTVLAHRAARVSDVYATVPTPDHPRCAVLPPDVRRIAIEGKMSDSIRAGLAALPNDVRGVIILPADMPDITANDLTLIYDTANQTDATIVRAATQDGLPGHPIYFSARIFERFKTLSGDRGAFPIASGLEDQTVLVPLSGDRARLDLDTPEDWAAYRARPPQRNDTPGPD